MTDEKRKRRRQNKGLGRVPMPRVIASYNGVACTELRPTGAPIRPGEPCGQIHEHCRAHVKPKKPDHERYLLWGDPCGDQAMVGQLVCRRHGGGTPQARGKGAERVADRLAEQALRKRFGRPVPREIRDPTLALARLAGELEQAKDAALEMVGELDDLLAGDDVHPYVKLYERLTAQCRGLLVDMAKVDTGDRIASIEQMQIELQFAAVLAALADAGVDSPEVRTAIAARLRALPADGTEQ